VTNVDTVTKKAIKEQRGVRGAILYEEAREDNEPILEMATSSGFTQNSQILSLVFLSPNQINLEQ